jgi:TRAP-type C4-dicarboxylate transport system permease small subunit
VSSQHDARENPVLQFLVVTLPRFILGSLIFVGIGINFANVVGRYVFSTPIVWAEEILAYIMIWCVSIGAILVTWEGRHIKMDLIAVHVPPPWNRIVNGLVAVGFFLVCVFVIRQSWTVVSMMVETGQQSMIARLPMGLMHAAILVGFSGMLVALLLRLGSYLRGEFGSDTEATAKEILATYGAFDDDDQKTRED